MRVCVRVRVCACVRACVRVCVGEKERGVMRIPKSPVEPYRPAEMT